MRDSDRRDSQELYYFAESYENYPELASNVAMDAQEAGQPSQVITFFESLGDTYLEDKDQVINMIEQVGDDKTTSMTDRDM